MELLSTKSLSDVKLSKTAVTATAKKTWTDRLPQACDLPDLFKTGQSFQDCIELVKIDPKSQDKICKKSCKCTVKECHQTWVKAAKSLILQKQLEKGLTGDSQLLTFYGKAILKQCEALPDADDVLPTVINIGNIDVNQEEEIAQLKAELKECYKKLDAIQAPVVEGG